MLQNVRDYALLLVSSASGGIAVFFISSAIERREWLSQNALIGLSLMLFAITLAVWDGKFKRRTPTEQDITPSEGLKK
jgi:hypothetical protein